MINSENLDYSEKSEEREKNKVEDGTLYLVATPIGNMSDISSRAIKVLTQVDFIAAEDTRNTGKLLNALGIENSLLSYHEHNKKQRGEQIVSKLKDGNSCAVVTDAGMPGISDPGEDLVKLCIEENIPVTCIPGPCAAVTAVALSGLNCERFCFEGFLPTVASERKKRLESLKGEMRTMIFYEAPHKLQKTLACMFDVFGDRSIALCREITKLNEEIVRTTLFSAVKKYENENPRGEFVLVLEGASEELVQKDSWWKDLSIEEHIDRYMDEDGLSKNDAIRRVAHDRGMSRNYLYKMIVKEINSDDQ